jgi:cytochrome c-type biogenesis protein CcmH
MNMTSLIIGFILGAVATYFFTASLKKPVVKEAAENADSENSQSGKASKINPMLGIILLVPILASLIYWKAGNPDAPSVSKPSMPMPPINMGATAPPMGEGHEMSDLGAMAQRLADKLAKNPEDADGWALLAHTYVEIKQHKDAVGAFEKATHMITSDPQLFADYADALAVTTGGQFDEQATALVEKALKLDPNHPKALMLAGTIAFKNADYKKAIKVWEHLQPLLPKDDAALAQDIANNIAEAKALSAKK